MFLKSRHPSCLLLLMLLGCRFAVGETPSALQVEVKDSEGAVIRDAHIVIHRDFVDSSSPSSDTIANTDMHGNLTVALAPGFYEVFVSVDVVKFASAKTRKRATKLH
jgi:hypothetical protein